MFLILSVFGCATQEASKSQFLDGFWQTNGYGYFFEIKGRDINIYELTSISCLESAFEPGRLRFKLSSDVDAVFGVELPGFIYSSFKIHPGPSDDVKYFQRVDTNTYMYTRKISEPPNICSENPVTSFEYVYSVFEEIFGENYPFFVARGVSRESFFKQERQLKIESEGDLFEKITDKIKPLDDLHTAVVAEILGLDFWGGDSVSEASLSKNHVAVENALIGKYPKFAPRLFCNDLIKFSYIGKEVGYLQVNSFSGFSKSEIFSRDLDCMEGALNKIFADSPAFRGLVIDLRFNQGGSDKLALNMAARFAQSEYTAYSKRAALMRNGGLDWTKSQEVIVRPNSSIDYHGEIVLLQSRHSASAAETFILSMMGREPLVKRLGERTRGAFSDILPRVLPNGWLLGLSNEEYIDIHGKRHEVNGISPHVVVPFDYEGVVDGHDSALEKALEILDG